MSSAAASRERNDKPYEEAGGYGKFRKRPFRRSTQTTPYDRPATAIRNSSNSNNGWLSKLVDPAQRLIASGAHKLFASVFRKRLPPPPAVVPTTQPPERVTEANQGTTDKQKETMSTTQGAAGDSGLGPANNFDRSGVTELELILKQKTFSRSEIDRLTALLQSRTVDLSAGDKRKKSEVIPSKAVLSPGRKEMLNTPVKDNGFDSCFNSTPVVGSSVLDEDVASPAELAKAYMGSRPSKVSPPMLEFRSQPFKENSTALTNHTFTPKSPMMLFVPRSAGHAGAPENGFVTPRFRGRSAIYSMARTPYSRVHSTAGLQGAGVASEAYGGPSSSSQKWENNRFSGSRQGASKRRSSVLDNDIGSAGPIRRIRQKSNLLTTSGAISFRGNGIDSNASQGPSLTEKTVLAGESSKCNADDSVCGAGFTPVSSKSSEMASKILQQLDVLVSSREKSPTKLSPSMLRGPALRSLENVDSLKLLENVSDNNKLDKKHDALLPDARDYLSQKQDKVEENGPSKPIISNDKSASAVNGADAKIIVKNDEAGIKAIAFPVISTIAPSPPQKKRAFRMSAHEDYLELDDDDYSNGTPSCILAEGGEKVDIKLAEKKISNVNAVIVEKPPAFSELIPPSKSTLNQKSAGMDGSGVAEKTTGFTFATPPLLTMSDGNTVVESKPASIFDDAALPKESNGSPQIFNSKEKVVLQKESNSPCHTYLGSKTGDTVSQFAFSSSSVMSDLSGPKFGLSSDAKPESSSFAAVTTTATESVTNGAGSDKAEDEKTLKAGGCFKATETVPSAPTSSAKGPFSSAITVNGSSLDDGSFASTPSSLSFASPPVFSNSIADQNSSSTAANNVASSSANATSTSSAIAIMNGSSSLSVSASAPSFTATPIFKFASPAPSTTAIPSTTSTETTETKTKETSFGSQTSAPFGSTSSPITSIPSTIVGGTSSAFKNTGNNIFGGATTSVTSKENSILGGTSAVTSTGSNFFNFNAGTIAAASNQSQGLNVFSAASAPASVAGTGFATSTQSIPVQLGSAPSFGLTASSAFSSSNSLFSSSTANMFSTSASLGLASSTSSSEASVVSSSSSPASSLFGWPPKSSGFSATFNPSSYSSPNLFGFGATSTSNAITSSAPVGFGSAANVSSVSSFAFSSPAHGTPSQPVFVNSSPSFAFGPSSSSNNDQMSMEDSMAEDTVQATTPSVPPFGQQTAASGFIFGSTAPTGGNQFGATPSGASPFQFGGQSNLAAPQNSSPFQASSSLEYNGGSFSLGTNGDKSNRRIVKVKKTQRKR